MIKMMRRRSAAKRAHRGALWMDEVLPQWYHRVSLPLLRMDRTWYCVLAQSHPSGSYHLATQYLGMDREQALSRGFIAFISALYPDLTQAWKREVLIRRRRDQQAVLARCKGIVNGWERYEQDRSLIGN